MHEAGVPVTALQLLPGEGSRVGAQLTGDPRINGVAFTGSTATARRIQSTMADVCAPGTPLIAETGGLNAMVVDSTALPEQAIKDILTSAFQSAGQRCSALRCLYVQEDMAEGFIAQLIGAMDQLRLGDPWDLSTDVGPIISPEAAAEIEAYCRAAEDSGSLLHRHNPSEPLRENGSFVAPALIAVDGIDALEREVFGPVLHVATYRAGELEAVIEAVNATGYGLTFGIHTRINKRIDVIFGRVRAGNVYANRNQIGAIVGSQPFGGEGLSGTGPKAGGPHYLPRFRQQSAQAEGSAWRGLAQLRHLSAEIAALAAEPVEPPVRRSLPGPTGETNELSLFPRAPMLCAGPGASAAQTQRACVEALGGRAVVAGGELSADALTDLPPIGGLLWWGMQRQGATTPGRWRAAGGDHPADHRQLDVAQVMLERHLCVDTTAAGGNASCCSVPTSERAGPARLVQQVVEQGGQPVHVVHGGHGLVVFVEQAQFEAFFLKAGNPGETDRWGVFVPAQHQGRCHHRVDADLSVIDRRVERSIEVIALISGAELALHVDAQNHAVGVLPTVPDGIPLLVEQRVRPPSTG